MEYYTGLAILTIFPICMLFATFYDLFTMTIPNRITLTLLVSFLILAPMAGMGWETMMWHMLISFLVLVVGYVFFSLGFMGGGDAKLFAASSLWFGTAFTLDFVLIASLFGGALTFLVVVGRVRPVPIWLMQFDWIMRLLDKKQGVPYGAALGPAALLVFVDTPWMEFISAGKLLG